MWEGMDPPLIRTLESLANLIDCHKENHSALRKQVVKLARSTVTLIKLQTTLYNKISNTTTNNMQFTMGTEINSKTLSLLHGYPNQILQQCDSYIRDLQESHDIGSMTMAKTKSLRAGIVEMSNNVDSNLALLNLYLIPLSLKTDRSPLETDIKAWLSEWQRSWHIAKTRVVDSMYIPRGRN
ncbi:hypothetical protein H4Q26_002628 [Puccinia striiformis f. sp. tritici PST-130]|nr:hypothetical protein H4Q26_002628 [Puccinia striiformis f. sp. tritici PST-130]